MGKRLAYLFLSFLKIGAFTFGGGYAMIALLEREFVEKGKVIGHDEFFDLVAIAESTPGPIAINVATYIGYRVSKFIGALVSTLAICIPSVTVIFCISLFFDAFLENEIVASAFRGVQVCVVYLILSAGIRMLKKMKKKPLTITLVTLAMAGLISVTLLSVRFSSVFFILIGAFTGILSYAIIFCKSKGKKEAGK